jgi:hypothetical protein
MGRGMFLMGSKNVCDAVCDEFAVMVKENCDGQREDREGEHNGYPLG